METKHFQFSCSAGTLIMTTVFTKMLSTALLWLVGIYYGAGNKLTVGQNHPNNMSMHNDVQWSIASKPLDGYRFQLQLSKEGKTYF